MTHYLTQDGLAELQAELTNITDVALPEALDSLNKAIKEGDLSENAAYDAAKQERDLLIDRKEELESILIDYEIIVEQDGKKASQTVVIGSNVKLEYVEQKTQFAVRIVGSSESDVIEGKISNESPLAQAILGKKVGSIASVKTKTGKLDIKILEIIS
jgi:transcription elongation factor GreA